MIATVIVVIITVVIGTITIIITPVENTPYGERSNT